MPFDEVILNETVPGFQFPAINETIQYIIVR